MRVYPSGVDLREFVHKNDAINTEQNCDFGASDSGIMKNK